MPPSTITSAVALIGLCSLAAIETGGCSNAPKSLISVTRSGLPLITSLLTESLGQLAENKTNLHGAALESSRENSEPVGVHDVGLTGVTGLLPQCGRYEFKPDGSLLVWDALSSSLPKEQVAGLLSRRDAHLSWMQQPDGSLESSREYMGRKQLLTIRESASLQLPNNCQRPMPPGTQTLLITAQTL